jgi:hypothetical protein
LNLSTHKKSEVDLKVAQELKNHQDFMYQTGQSLNRLTDGIKQVASQQERVACKVKSDQTAILIEFENLRDSVLQSMKEMNKRLGDVETKLFEVLDSFVDLREEITVKNLTKQEFFDAFVPHVKHVQDIEAEMDRRDVFLDKTIVQTQAHFKNELAVVKKDLTPEIPKEDPIKKQIDQRLQVFKVDFDGLIKEINILKKTSTYDQKKFENLYTLIERLKEGKECHKKA